MAQNLGRTETSWTKNFQKSLVHPTKRIKTKEVYERIQAGLEACKWYVANKPKIDVEFEINEHKKRQKKLKLQEQEGTKGKSKKKDKKKKEKSKAELLLEKRRMPPNIYRVGGTFEAKVVAEYL